ncbi:unnamed protein product [Parnassius mnemosyne]|uniref:Uncharacterized protein n=1 Tax=Parnassius mnemosyne TaxID=213953 RepID=A0AAV1KSU6_9NEOP
MKIYLPFRQMHYPPETTSVMLLVRILAFIEQSSNPSAAAATVKQFCHRTVNEDAELVHKLLGEQFTEQLNTLRELTANVINGDHVEQVRKLFIQFKYILFFIVFSLIIFKRENNLFCDYIKDKLHPSNQDCMPHKRY